jgi:CheY-like chemotaxis protein
VIAAGVAEECPVSRILVADDNSNIQKMVALALKDEGIDVVAVGNGEAAMRKIPDLRPDLVLADIFMPVRNGYEVCEFVKSDSRYMSTPVVLLVGAFDPLDEQETQRVRADGVLKKPFVPPDPLINMVKALLAKSNGQKPLPVPTAIPPKPAAPVMPPLARPNSILETQVAPAPPLPNPPERISLPQQQPAAFVPPPSAPPAFVPPAPIPVFQSVKTEDPDEVTTATRDPNLGEPFWAAPAQTEESEEVQSDETQPEDMTDMHSFGKDEPAVEEIEEEAPAFRPGSSSLNVADFEADLGQTMVSQTAPTPTAPQAKSSEPAAEKIELDPIMAAPPPPAPSALSEAPDIFKFDPTLTFAVPPHSATTEEASAQADTPTVAELSSAPPVNDQPAAFSWPGVTDAAPAAPEKPLETHDADSHQQLEAMELELSPLPNHDAVITAATEAARQAFSELNTLPGSGALAETSGRHAGPPEHKDSFSAPAVPETPASPTPEMIDAVVNRLLEHMQPQIMEVVNREVLRPAIEAIVRREMKKS